MTVYASEMKLLKNGKAGGHRLKKWANNMHHPPKSSLQFAIRLLVLLVALSLFINLMVQKLGVYFLIFFAESMISDKYSIREYI